MEQILSSTPSRQSTRFDASETELGGRGLGRAFGSAPVRHAASWRLSDTEKQEFLSPYPSSLPWNQGEHHDERQFEPNFCP